MFRDRTASMYRICQEGEQVNDHTIVDSVRILDIERIEIMGHLWVESSWLVPVRVHMDWCVVVTVTDVRQS
jgi:hypothetical protein